MDVPIAKWGAGSGEISLMIMAIISKLNYTSSAPGHPKEYGCEIKEAELPRGPPSGPGAGAAGTEWALNFLPGSEIMELFTKERKLGGDEAIHREDASKAVEALLLEVNTEDDGLVDANVGMMLLKPFSDHLGYFNVPVQLLVYKVSVLLFQKMGGQAKAFCATEEAQALLHLIFEKGCLANSVNMRVQTAAYECLDEWVKVTGIETMFPYLQIIVDAPVHVKGVYRLSMMKWLKGNLPSKLKRTKGKLRPLLKLTVTCITDHKNGDVRKKYEKFLETVLNNVGRETALLEVWDDLPDNTKKLYAPERDAYLKGEAPPPPPKRKTAKKFDREALKKQRKKEMDKIKTPRASRRDED